MQSFTFAFLMAFFNFGTFYNLAPTTKSDSAHKIFAKMKP